MLLLVSWVRAHPVLELAPAPGEQVREERPNIQVSWPASISIQGRHCRLWLNGKEVTSECLRSDRFLSYRPYRPLAPGRIQVRFWAEPNLEKSWEFELSFASWLTELSHNAVGDLFEEDELEVRFRAPAGGSGSFQVADLAPVKMTEKEPGLYVGVFSVKGSDCALAASVVVSYRKGEHTEQAVLPGKVKVFGGFYRVKVLSPPDGSQVEQSFILKGKVRAGSRVTVIPKVGFSGVQAPTTNSTSVGGTAGSIPADVDEHGNFELEYGLPLLLPGMQVVFSIFAVDPAGNRSVPTIVRYRFK